MWRFGVAVYAVLQGIGLLWWLAFYPGMLSLDTVSSIRHVTTGPWDSRHSVLYDLLIGASLKLTGDLGALTLAQTAGLAAALAWLCVALARLGVPRWATAGAALLLALLPSSGSFAVTMWKDIPYTICLILVTATVAELLARRRTRRPYTDPPGGDPSASTGTGPDGDADTLQAADTAEGADPTKDAGTREDADPTKDAGSVSGREHAGPAVPDHRAGAPTGSPTGAEGPEDRGSRVGGRGERVLVAALGAELLALTLFRNNGFVTVVPLVALLVILLPGVRLRVLAAGVAALVVWAAVFLAGYRAAGIERGPSAHTFGTVLHDIAVVYAERPGSFRAEDLALMERVAPLEVWRRGGSTCFTINRLLFAKRFDWDAESRVHGRVLGLWADLLRREPGRIAGVQACRGSIAWWPVDRDPAAAGASYKYPKAAPRLEPRDAAHTHLVSTRPLSADLHRIGTAALPWSAEHSVLWRGALWAYLGYLSVIVLAVRRRAPALLALAAAVAAQQLSVLVLIPAQDARYMMPCLILGVVLSPAAFALKSSPCGSSTCDDVARR
ncbi:hypothetical protein [Bailinhaonella thermotolerans]|uniref:Glycosyltransferase RgtA/B/C/D-like domain-containing protein n=1 Tax=Bailinhaonella thermotolerans TaxID=1070861 RepID=A0A3A4AU19_9ACTN|nr:hypothetical protein [Bailinhaonella thermotolerans]RJL33045.1 hypothetical protein D5H75_09265 [Bailinhaonella thermotolerans]